VVAVVAEGDGEEDDPARGPAELERLGVGARDAVVGVSASGTTPFTLAALEAAAAAGALTIAVSCARGTPLAEVADHEVAVVVGPEVVAGSTRLKAGTAQKLVLNAISTVTMIRRGRTFGGLMVAVEPGNAKLRERARRNVALACGASESDVDAALAAAEGDARVALVSLLAGVDASDARERLAGSGGSVAAAVGGAAR
jgi:N-acetylmuramic acid 6-phosphate etherase